MPGLDAGQRLHELWHFFVLGLVLLGAAGIGIVAVAPLAFQSPPPALRRTGLALVIMAGLGGILILGEWLLVH